MKVFFKNVEERHLGRVAYPGGPNDSDVRAEPWFWVVHPADSAKDFLTDIEYRAAVKNCIDRGGGILFLKGTRFAGMDTEADAEALEIEYEQRIHCLRVACSEHSPKIVERIHRFLREIEERGPGHHIPWEKVEPPPWPESMVAVYLLLKTIEASPEDADKIRDAWNDLDPTWRQNLWTEAWREYSEERSLNNSEWLQAGLPEGVRPTTDLPEMAQISKAAAVIKQCLSGKH